MKLFEEDLEFKIHIRFCQIRNSFYVQRTENVVQKPL